MCENLSIDALLSKIYLILLGIFKNRLYNEVCSFGYTAAYTVAYYSIYNFYFSAGFSIYYHGKLVKSKTEE